MDKNQNLTAKVTGDVTHFDNVQYRLHVALFDKSGGLLGTASTVIEAKRFGVGYVGRARDKVFSLNFGVSRAYTQTGYFALALSDVPVATPDQWAAVTDEDAPNPRVHLTTFTRR